MSSRRPGSNATSNIPFKKPKLSINFENGQAAAAHLDDSDDDEFILKASQAIEGEKKPPMSTQVNFEDFMSVFENGTKTSTQQDDDDEIAVRINAKVSSKLVLQSNQSIASEKFYKEKAYRKIDLLQKKEQECRETAERLQIREYELSSLKNELNVVQRTNADLRNKLIKNGQVQEDARQNRIVELEKRLRKAESELELKNLAMVKIKSDNRWSKGLADTTGGNPKGNVYSNCFVFHVNEPKLLSFKSPIDPKFKQRALDGYETSKKSDYAFRQQCTKLQFLVAQIMAGGPGKETDLEEIAKSLIALAIECLSMIRTVVSQLKGDLYSNLGSLNKILAIDSNSEYSIYDKEKIYEEEKNPASRHMVSLFSLVCRACSTVRKAFIDSYQALDILTEIVKIIGFSNEVYEYMGIIRASSTLLLNLKPISEEHQQRYLSLFKAIVLSRPDLSTLQNVSTILSRMSSEKWFVVALCQQSKRESFIFNPNDEVIYFTDSSCPLQVFAVLAESTFMMDDQFDVQRFGLLLDRTRHILIFYRNCIAMRSVNWLTKHTSSSSQQGCECYVKISTSVIVLLHLSVKVFKDNRDEYEPHLLRLFLTVSQLGILLINDIFNVNMQMKMRLNMGRRVKDRLIAVYNLLQEYNDLFSFRLTQVKALDFFEVDLFSSAVKTKESDQSEDKSDCRELGKQLRESCKL